MRADRGGIQRSASDAAGRQIRRTQMMETMRQLFRGSNASNSAPGNAVNLVTNSSIRTARYGTPESANTECKVNEGDPDRPEFQLLLRDLTFPL